MKPWVDALLRHGLLSPDDCAEARSPTEAADRALRRHIQRWRGDAPHEIPLLLAVRRWDRQRGEWERDGTEADAEPDGAVDGRIALTLYPATGYRVAALGEVMDRLGPTAGSVVLSAILHATRWLTIWDHRDMFEHFEVAWEWHMELEGEDRTAAEQQYEESQEIHQQWEALYLGDATLQRLDPEPIVRGLDPDQAAAVRIALRSWRRGAGVSVPNGHGWQELGDVDFGRPEPPLVLCRTLGDAVEASFDDVFSIHQEYIVPPCWLHLLDTSDDAAFRSAWLDLEAVVRAIADIERIFSLLQVPGRIH